MSILEQQHRRFPKKPLGMCLLLCGIGLANCYAAPENIPKTPEWDMKPGEKRPDRPTVQQREATMVPEVPDKFSPDPNSPFYFVPPKGSIVEIDVVREVTKEPLKTSDQFNPDPGAGMDAPTEKAEQPDAPKEPARAKKNNPFFFKDPAPRPFFEEDVLAEDEGYFSGDSGVKRRGPSYKPEIPDGMVLPRRGVERRQVEVDFSDLGDPERYDPDIPQPFQLPREDVRFEERISKNWHAGHYDHVKDPEGFTSVEDRWNLVLALHESGAPLWSRYADDRTAETPYERKMPYFWHPYYQSKWKADVPFMGQDYFASFTLQNTSEFEFRNVPTPAGVSTARPGGAEFYGDGDGTAFVTNTSFTIDVFRGEASFKPIEWMFRIQPVYNTNYISVQETGLVSPDPRGLGSFTNPSPGNNFNLNPGIVNPGDIDSFLDPLLFPARQDFHRTDATERFADYLALQQLFFEIHLMDLSDNYDFAAARFGTQTFNADFRGHVFFDSNLGYRLFGNLWKNKLQYNLAFFDLLEKESFSELNTWEDRNQHVFVANLYWQDLFVDGYTAQVNFLANWDNGSDSGLVFDSAGNIVRPTPLGTIAPHDLQAYYIGLNGEGHFGRMNISHSLYHVFGKDDLNGIAGSSVDISAWMAALELSVDTDWMRHKFTLFYGSGDDDASDNKATGWDSIVDNPNLIGAPFSYWQRQGPNLGGTAVALKQRLSLIPNLRSNKFLGQSSFVNPGIFIAGIGEEWELTPKTRLFANLNYLMFMNTDSIGASLLTDEIDREIGWDLSFGVLHRPFLTENLKLTAGVGLLFPGAGLKDIYRTTAPTVTGFTTPADEMDDVLISGFFSAALTF
jgi:hypothetical protein